MTTREMVVDDLAAVASVCDEALGAGFWSLDMSAAGCHRVALQGETVVGMVSAAVVATVAEAPEAVAPVGLVRLLVVAPEARGRGVGTRLLEEATRACVAQGAATLVAFAWVHPSGARPSAGVLERAGFVRGRRLDDFFAGTLGAQPCPACGHARCRCAVDVYARACDADARET